MMVSKGKRSLEDVDGTSRGEAEGTGEGRGKREEMDTVYWRAGFFERVDENEREVRDESE